jgi:hypothetical protein
MADRPMTRPDRDLADRPVMRGDRDSVDRPVAFVDQARNVLATRPRAVLGGAVALVALLVVLALSVGRALSAPDAPDPVNMTPARAVVTPSKPVRAVPARPAAPKPVNRTPTSRAVPKHVPVESATGEAYRNGLDMARCAAGGNPWSGLVP